LALILTKESKDLLFATCVPMVENLEIFGKGYMLMNVAKEIID
jgi:hypothetical protein